MATVDPKDNWINDAQEGTWVDHSINPIMFDAWRRKGIEKDEYTDPKLWANYQKWLIDNPIEDV